MSTSKEAVDQVTQSCERLKRKAKCVSDELDARRERRARTESGVVMEEMGEEDSLVTSIEHVLATARDK